MTPARRRELARIAAHTRWAKCDDRTAATAAARQAAFARFERLVDPDQALSPDERARRAEHAQKAHMAKARLRRK